MQKSFFKIHRFEQLYKENYARLYYYTFRFIMDEEVCKDIVNDIFEKAWQNFGRSRNLMGINFYYPYKLRPLPYGNESIGSACTHRATFINTGLF